MIPKEALTGVILAGGQSRRMGQSKALLPLGKQTFLERVVAAALPLVKEVAVVGLPALTGHWNGTLWTDNYVGLGPVAGIETALRAIKTPHALVLSCDLPLLSTTVLNFLINNSQVGQHTIFSLYNQWQPLIGIYAKTAQPYFEQALQQQQLRLMTVLQQLQVVTCPCPKQWAAHLSNINTPQAYQQLLYDFKG